MRFLGHPHCISGPVVHGKQLGRTIGIPTANLLIPQGVLVPAFGVYATKVLLPDGQEKLAVTNVGVRPTVDDSQLVTVEPWILDYAGDLYGERIRVDFYQRLRGEKKFAGLQELQQEILKNAQETRALLTEMN
jgi:riboflavin kinase/FMN adenylyltransferase